MISRENGLLSLLDCARLLRARKCRRLIVNVCVMSTVFLIVVLLTGLTIFDRQHNNILHEYVAAEDDLAILDTSYFKKSKSYPPNTVVVLLNAHQVFHLKHSELRIESTNSTHALPSNLRLHPVVGELPFYCKWVPFLAIGQVVPEMTSLRMSSGGTVEAGIELSYRTPSTVSHSVVSCFTPLFLNERWQLFLLSAEIYSHYGAFLQFYVRSMLSDVHRLIRSYPNSHVQPWPAIQLGSSRASPASFDPNAELEFRNQAAAMTHCLLTYKESTSYIIFPDLDDVIIPRLGETYFREFEHVFSLFPEAAAIAYNMSQASLRSAVSPSLYSPRDVIRSIRMKGDSRWGKLVVKPQRLDSVWIHKSYGINEGFRQETLPLEMNSVLHLRFWKFSRNNTFALLNRDVIPRYSPTNGSRGAELISKDDLDAIQLEFENRMEKVAGPYTNLPTVSIYYPLIERCYNKIFYNGAQHSTCKGPELCDLPPFPGIRCMNVRSEFESYSGYDRLHIHKLVSAELEESHRGCSL